MHRSPVSALALLALVGLATGHAQEAPVDSSGSVESPEAATPSDSTRSSDSAAEPDGGASASDPVSVNQPVEAQATPQTETTRPSSRLIEEIIVTAQKREENVQDVPISINAFSAATLDARGIGDPKELPQATPGLTVTSQAGWTVTYLRGVGSDAFLLADPSIALYIDNVYMPFSHGQAQNFGSIQRIEVLKGPQGTLFGRNAVGGAISVTTEAPSFSAASGSVTTSYGSFDDLQTKAQLNIPLTDTLAVGISGLYNNADNYLDGTTGGVPLPKEVTKGFRARLRWAPVEQFDVTLSAFKLRQIGMSTLFSTNSHPNGVWRAVIPPQTGRGGVNDDYAYFDLENRVFYGQATLFTDWCDVKVLGSDQHVQTAARNDFDGSPVPLVHFEVKNQGADVQTGELQLLSNDTSWASDRLTWILGYYYYTGKAGYKRIQLGFAGSLLGPLNDALGPILEPLGIPPLVPEDSLIANGSLKTDSHSVYVQGTYHVTDWFAGTLGARLQNEKRTLLNSGGAVATPQEDLYYTSFSGQSDTTKSVSPKVSLEFRPWDEGLIYTSYQKAVKSSTYNVVNFLRFTEPEPVKKEELTAYEVGVKKQLFGDTTTVSAAAFIYDIKNLQVQFISLLAGGAVTFENAPAAEVKGVDFDLTSQLLPNLLPNLVLTLGGAFVDAKFTDYEDAQGYGEDGVYSDGNDYTGHRIPRSPRFTGTSGLSQTFQIPGGSLEVAGDYYYNSGFYYLADNTSYGKQHAYGVLGARISYLYEPWDLRVTLFGKNLLDKDYYLSRYVTDFGVLDAYAPPVTYGVRLNWQF